MKLMSGKWLRSFSATFFGIALALTAGAADFAKVKRTVNLDLLWSDIDGEKSMELKALHVPRQIRIHSITFEQNLDKKFLILDFTEIQNQREIQHQVRTLPYIESKKNAAGAYLEVGAILDPQQLGSSAPAKSEDGDRIDRYYFALSFQTNETFAEIRDLSLVLLRSQTEDRYHISEKESEELRYVVRPRQLELQLNDPIQLPPVIDTHAYLGSKRNEVGLRFLLPQSNRDLLMELRAAGIPESLDLPSVEVAAGLLGVQVKLPFRDLAVKEPVLQHLFGSSLFVIMDGADRYPLKFRQELPRKFAGMKDEYKLVFEFRTDEYFSSVRQVKLSLYRETISGDEYHPFTSQEHVTDYLVEDIQFQLPIYPGDAL